MEELQLETETRDTASASSSLLIHGDVLEATMSHVSVLDLLSASRVSKAWRRAVSFSLRSSPRPIPWLLIHHPQDRHRRAATHAYDPRTRAWVSIPGAPTPPPSARDAPLRPAHSAPGGGLLCVLAPAKLALSSDPFGATWTEVEAPRVWRRDPAVAAVGPRVVVAGGAFEFEDDACAVEVYRRDGGTWEACEGMPEVFHESASAMWLSVAASERRMYVLEKRSGWASWLDLEKGKWGATRQVQPVSAIATANNNNNNQWLWAIGHDKDDRLILVGACGGGGGGEGSSIIPKGVSLWTMEGEKLEVEEEIGKMPREMVEGLVARDDDDDINDDGDGEGLTKIGFCCLGGLGYIFNPIHPREFFLFELGSSNKSSRICRWERIPAPAAVQADGAVLRRMLIGCSLPVHHMQQLTARSV